MGRGQGAKNNIWGSNGQKCSKFGENYKPTDWKKLNKSQAQNVKKASLRHTIIKLLKASDKEKIKRSWEKRYI